MFFSITPLICVIHFFSLTHGLLRMDPPGWQLFIRYILVLLFVTSSSSLFFSGSIITVSVVKQLVKYYFVVHTNFMATIIGGHGSPCLSYIWLLLLQTTVIGICSFNSRSLSDNLFLNEFVKVPFLDPQFPFDAYHSKTPCSSSMNVLSFSSKRSFNALALAYCKAKPALSLKKHARTQSQILRCSPARDEITAEVQVRLVSVVVGFQSIVVY